VDEVAVQNHLRGHTEEASGEWEGQLSACVVGSSAKDGAWQSTYTHACHGIKLYTRC
jgi:hypothetical protein